MVITVHTISGTNVTGADFSVTDKVKTAKEILAKHLGVVPSQLMLLHGEAFLQDSLVLEDVCGDNASEACLTVIIVPQLIFCFKTSCAFESMCRGGSDTSASIVAVFKDGTADIVINEYEVTHSECVYHDDLYHGKDPYGDYGAWLARYVGTVRYMDNDDFSIDVTICQRRGIYNLAAPPSVIKGKWLADGKGISLEVVFGARSSKSPAAGKAWIMLQQRDKLPAEYARNIQEVAEVWAPRFRNGDAKVGFSGKEKSKYCLAAQLRKKILRGFNCTLVDGFTDRRRRRCYESFFHKVHWGGRFRRSMKNVRSRLTAGVMCPPLAHLTCLADSLHQRPHQFRHPRANHSITDPF